MKLVKPDQFYLVSFTTKNKHTHTLNHDRWGEETFKFSESNCKKIVHIAYTIYRIKTKVLEHSQTKLNAANKHDYFRPSNSSTSRIAKISFEIKRNQIDSKLVEQWENGSPNTRVWWERRTDGCVNKSIWTSSDWTQNV